MGTKTAIKKEFMKEYAHKSLESITIKELCFNTPVARTTFYNYYHNMDELKAESEDDLIKDLRHVIEQVSDQGIQKMDFEVFLHATFTLILEHWSYFYAFLILQPNMRFEEKWKEAIKVHFSMRYPEAIHAPNYELMTEMMASAVLGGYRYWMKHIEDVNENEFVRMVNEMLNDFVEKLKKS